MASEWSFLSNYGHVMVLISSQPQVTYREIAHRVGISERFAHKVVSDLVKNGYLKVKKKGRQNSYKIVKSKFLKHELESQCKLVDLLNFIHSTRREK